MLLSTLFCFTGAALAIPAPSNSSRSCKVTPFDSEWPSIAEWNSLNSSIGGRLLQTTPVASSCWTDNPFGSQVPCDIVDANWTNSKFHASLPESVGAPIFANNSCLPPDGNGFLESKGCHLGGLPLYIVNATTEQQVATAMKWAAEKNMRIVVKGTGHELSGRSSGANALSIWTRQFNYTRRNRSFALPGCSNATEDVFHIGSGVGWGDVLNEALAQQRIVTTGQDGSVGPGGYISGGGHGPIASTYGLAAQQVLQVTIVTPRGEILTANDAENADIFWAVRGGGGGQYGVITEFVIKHFPAPSQVSMGTLSIAPVGTAVESASWDAVAHLMSRLPDLMDAGVAGAMSLSSGATAQKFNPSLKSPTSGAVASQVLWAFNVSASGLHRLVDPVVEQLRSYGTNNTLTVSFSASEFQNYTSFYSAISGSNTAGSGGISSSRLLGREELSKSDLRSYLQRAVAAQNATAGTFATIGLSGGLGVHKQPEDRWGALISSWKRAYLHLYVGGASGSVDEDTTPQKVLQSNAEWIEEAKEELWREWAPNMGSYMNEANPYNTKWKKDYYGENYQRLLEIKKKYDPHESLFVLTGVGSDQWEYDLQSGTLCRA